MAVVSINLQEPDVPQWAQGNIKSWFWYYENCYGEQWVARFDGEVLRIAGFDVGWETIDVELGKVSWELTQVRQQLLASTSMKSWRSWVLNDGELYWIASMLEALAHLQQLSGSSETSTTVGN